MQLFTQSEADYFREAGIGDLAAYFRRAGRLAQQLDAAAGVVLFNLLEEIMVRNTRPYIRAAYPAPRSTAAGRVSRAQAAHGRAMTWERVWRPVRRDRGRDRGLSLAPYQARVVSKKIGHPRRKGARMGGGPGDGVGRYLQNPVPEAAGVEHRRVSREPAAGLVFEETYLEYLLDGKVVSSRDFHRLMRFLCGRRGRAGGRKRGR